MESFHTIVLTIAVIILILALTVIGIMMTNKTYDSSVYPPTTNECPDYWTGNTVAGVTTCTYTSGKNTGENISGTTTPKFTSGTDTKGRTNTTIDFNDAGWSSNGGTKLCNQKDWAIKYGISWDGVANYNGCK